MPGIGEIELAPEQADTQADAAVLPDPALLEKLANELFHALPERSTRAAGDTDVVRTAPVPGGTSPTAPADVLAEPALQSAPGAAAGATGQSADAFAGFPASADIGAPFYFLRGGNVTSPRAAPALNVMPAGSEPPFGVSAPASFTALDPRSLAGRSTPPGVHSASTAPATPGVEIGSFPAAGAVSPASAFDFPGESELRTVPAALAGAAGASPQHVVGVPTSVAAGSSFYFLDSIHTVPPRAATPLNIKLRDADLDLLPDLGLEPASISPSLSAGTPVTAVLPASEPADSRTSTFPRGPASGSPFTSAGEASEVSLYVVDESRSFVGTPRSPGMQKSGHRPARVSSAHPAFDVYAVRRDFPILQERVHGHPLIWLDNAATTQKPRSVIDRLSYFYEHENSNIHRAAHELAARATDAYEAARDKVARFLHASSSDEIVFVRGTTEGINLVAQTWGRRNVGKDDEIVITWLEHHANIVPWQQLCAEKGARLRVAPVDDDGQVLLDEYEKLLGPRTRLVAFSQVSNALGTVTPAREMVEIAHRYGARVLVDGAQAVSHMRVDVQALDCDWYVFSGHKVFGPTGIGAVFGKGELLNATPPWQGGGNMIKDVTFEKTLYQQAPGRFEAGTGNIADAVGLGAALDYVERIGIENVQRYEHDLLVYATRGLASVPGLRLDRDRARESRRALVRARRIQERGRRCGAQP